MCALTHSAADHVLPPGLVWRIREWEGQGCTGVPKTLRAGSLGFVGGGRGVQTPCSDPREGVWDPWNQNFSRSSAGEDEFFGAHFGWYF